MIGSLKKRPSRRPRTPHARTIRLRCEPLEERTLLSVAGAAWGNAAHLTLSFAPDGTDVAGQSSDLFTTFDNGPDAATWQQAILTAFQSWAVHANVDVGLAADGGQPLGTPGPTQQDERFGDVRIAAMTLAPDVMAISVGHDDFSTGTWSGDVLFNTGAAFGPGNIFSVALHEAGHVLGLGHSDDPSSPMHVHGPSSAVAPTGDDIALLQSLYGQRVPDPNEQNDAATNNDTEADATELVSGHIAGGDEGTAPAIVYGDVTTTGDVDFFALQGLSDYAGPITFQVRSDGISLLAFRLSVLDHNGQLIEQAAVSGLAGGEAAIRIPQNDPDETYFVKVQSARSDVHGVGGYSLAAAFDDVNQLDEAAIDRFAGGDFRLLDREQLQQLIQVGAGAAYNDDAHTNDEPGFETELGTTAGYAESTRYDAVGGISDATDVDLYKFQSPDAAPGEPLALTAAVRSLEAGGLMPRVTVFDEDRNPVSTHVLVNGGGRFTAQLAGAEPDKEYFVRVDDAGVEGLFDTGNYALTVSFGGTAAQTELFAAGSLDDAEPIASHTLHVGETGLFHLAMQAAETPVDAPTVVAAWLIDAGGHSRVRLASRPGETRTVDGVLLTPGTYRLDVAVASFASPLPAIGYTILGALVSDPFGVDPEDPTGDPVHECPDDPSMFCYPGDVRSTDPFLWDDFLESLPEVPNLSGSELADLLLGDWWSWFWNQDPANGPPLSLDDQYQTDQDAVLEVDPGLGVLHNDVEPESHPVSAILLDDVRFGALTLQLDGSFVYLPDPLFFGIDTFRYATYDFHQQSNVSTVQITVARTTAPPAVAGRSLFYNASAFDGNDPASGAADDAALADDKTALLPGRLASSSNYTNYSQGINGLVVDVRGLEQPALISAADFRFRVGNSDDPGAWTTVAASPSSVEVRDAAGAGASDRIAIAWPNRTIVDRWLQVTVLSNAITGLPADDVFYFGNAVGETFNGRTDALVGAADVIAIRDNPRGPANPASIDDPYDLNRDGRVDATDVVLARNNATSPLSALRLIAPQATPAAAPPAFAGGPTSRSPGEGESTLPTGSPASADALAPKALDHLLAAQAARPAAVWELPAPTLGKLLRRLGSAVAGLQMERPR